MKKDNSKNFYQFVKNVNLIIAEFIILYYKNYYRDKNT